MKLTLATALALGIVTLTASPARAEGTTYTATCDALSVTAQPGEDVHFGIDDQPPYGVIDGHTNTVAFPAVTTHTYTIQNMTTGEYIIGNVSDCDSPAPAPVAPPAEPPRYVAPSPFAGMELMPPW
ncbi:MAG TPA: hypothetical protein VHN36_07400 [Ilumatobacteraceae bacterium]|jgi:hypothetical protein|nr:hypothetical protein [Ilumatobacteraceae bacterium]